MNRRTFLTTAAYPWGLVSAQRKPNILLILADDLGFADLGFQGAKDVATPHLDAIARSGIRFTNSYVSHPFCSPARAGILTGRYQQRFGHENNMVFDPEDPVTGLPLEEVTLADMLKGAGYKTGLVGKWHLGAHPRFHPKKRGFDEMYGFIGGGHDYFNPGDLRDKREHLFPIERDGEFVKEKEYLTTALGREAASFVKRHAADPFFLYMAFNAPHTPLQAPDSYLDRYAAISDPNRRRYAAMISAMDDAIGRVITSLREARIEDETLIFFLSDNGGPTGNASSNKPFRGTKRTLYEGGIRVPFVLRWPGRVPAGSVFDHPVISLDIFPTALAAAGLPLNAARKLDGVNLLPYIKPRRSAPPHRQLFWRTFGGVEAAIRETNWKWVRHGQKPPEMFDLEKDPGETTNLAMSQPRTAARLQSDWENWSREMVEPRWIDHIFHGRPNR